jgi:cobalt/nickel transport protein
MAARSSWWLMGAAALIVAGPLVLGSEGEFKGTDDRASQVIEQSHPGYQRLAEPLWKPPSPEIESLIFALQAAAGAGLLGYVIGRRHGSKGRDGADR